MTIERLRSLEKEWRKESDDFERDGDEDSASAYYNCAERLSDLIAELGQEVGAVADERLCDFFADVGEVEQFMDDLCNVVTELTGDEGEDDPVTVLRRYIASPAHTSEARDALLSAAIEARQALSAIYASDGLTTKQHFVLERLAASIDAAMRQDGGND